MKLFNFHVHSKEELDLIEGYIATCMILGISEATASKMAKQAMQMAIADAKKTGTYYLPSNLYDVVFNGATPSDVASKLYIRGIDLNKLRAGLSDSLQELRNMGMSEEDIKDFMNRSSISMLMRVEVENVKFLLALAKLRISEPNLSEEEASKAIAKRLPLYGSFNKYTFDIRNHEIDGILSPELINQVQNYINKRLQENPASFEQEITLSSSMNALIRKEISAGRLFS